MARRQTREIEETPEPSVVSMEERKKPEREKPDTVKLGITLTGSSAYKFRILATCLGLRPSMLLQQLVSERIRGFALPRGYAYTPPDAKVSMESAPIDSEAGEAA
jgi:hypothetical protein